jgi:hypothetical protein
LNRIGVEADFVKLVGKHLHIVWVGVTNTDDSMAAIEVKVLLPLVVPYATALSLDWRHIKE